MDMPDTSPIINPIKENHAAKVIPKEDTPWHLRALMDHARAHGQEKAEQTWNDVIDFFAEKLNDREHTGNDYLSMMGTFLTYFNATWFIMMKTLIADKDEAGVGYSDVVEPIFEGVRKLITHAKVKEKTC